ncbi:MAG: hypothetical protein ACFBSC_13110 [Microcoleaceae cyanobacterium]
MLAIIYRYGTELQRPQPMLSSFRPLQLQQVFCCSLAGLMASLCWITPSLAQSSEPKTDPIVGDLGKQPKHCFADIKDIPDSPLSQTEPGVPSLWLAEDLYGRVSQQAQIVPLLGIQESKPESESSESEQSEKQTKSSEIPVSEQTAQESPPEPEVLLQTWFVEPETVQLTSTLAVDNLVTVVVNRLPWTRERYLGQYVFIKRFGFAAGQFRYNLRVCNPQGEWLGHYLCDFDTSPLECNIQLRTEGFQIRDFKVFPEEVESIEAMP